MLLTLSEFDLLSVDSVAQACLLLHRHGDEARVFAGGTDLLVKMKHKRIAARYLINIKPIRELDFIEYDERNGLRIGALTTIESIRDSSLVAQEYPQLRQAAAKMGTLHIRNLGTLGGNLANSSPSAEFAPALLTLNASVNCRDCDTERSVPLEEFFVGPGSSVLRGDEILTEVRVPPVPAGAAGVYAKRSLRRMDVAIASAAVFVVLEGDVVRDARIALGAVGPTPFRVRKCEAEITGHRLTGGSGDRELFEEVARLASEQAAPIDDIRSDAPYRRKAVAALVGRGLEESIQRARAASPRRTARQGGRRHEA